MSRPRGVFGNPNVSTLLININVLFINLSIRQGLLVVHSVVTMLGIIILPLFICLVLACRGEFVVALILCLLNYLQLYKSLNILGRGRLLVGTVILFIGLGLSIPLLNQIETIQSGLKRVETLNTMSESEERIDESSGRVLLFTKVGAIDRFLHSPILGTGFSEADFYPFDYGTQYFHNDWVRLFVTSGVVGVFAMLVLIRRFAWPLGWPVIIPFILPGCLNSFMLCIQAFTFYWFMVGLLREKKRRHMEVGV